MSPPASLATRPHRDGRGGRILGLVLLVGYATAVGVQIVDHAMWRDEAQAWLIARASSGPVELWQNLRFEGHPPLWHLVIWPVARLSANVEAIKVVTFAITAVFAGLIALGSVVPSLLRPLLLAGFLPIFGYGVLSRPYMLGLVLLFGWLELYAAEQDRDAVTFRARAIIAVLLSLTHLMFAVVALALIAGDLLDWFRRRGGAGRQRLTWAVGSGLTIVVLTVIFLPDRSGTFVPSTLRVDELGVRPLARALVEAFGALPGVPSWIVLLLTGTLLGLAILVSPLRAGALAAAILVLVANRLIGFGGQWWHVGVTTSAFLAASLLALLSCRSGEATARRLRGHGSAISLLLVPLLTAQAFLAWSWFDRNGGLPYSSGREAAAIVEDWCRPDCPLVVDWSASGATVSAYLRAQPTYRLDDRREGTFAVWDSAHGTGEVSWDALREALRERGTSAIGVVASLREPPRDFIIIGSTGPAVWRDEEFLIVTLAPS